MKKRTLLQILRQLIYIDMVLITLTPIILTLFATLKTKGDMVKALPLLLSPAARITFDNFKKMLGDKYLVIKFRNTGAILVVSIFFSMMFGTTTAFILERFQFRFKGVIMALFFLGMLIPNFVTEIARFKIINGADLHDTLGAPIIIYAASDLMQLYIYRQFIPTPPMSLDGSTLLDGRSYFELLRRITLPLLVPTTAMMVIIRAVTIINDMCVPYLYMLKNKLRTLAIPLMSYANAQKGSRQQLAVDITIIMSPTVLIYIFFQEYILTEVAAGAMKE